jgi:hypothetical protein
MLRDRLNHWITLEKVGKRLNQLLVGTDSLNPSVFSPNPLTEQGFPVIKAMVDL